jgi:hypothetical protein
MQSKRPPDLRDYIAGHEAAEAILDVMRPVDKTSVLKCIHSTTDAVRRNVQTMIGYLKLDQKYGKAVDAQKSFGLPRPGDTIPDFDQVLDTFTPRMLATVVTRIHDGSSLILQTKGRSFFELTDALDGNKDMPHQGPTHIHSDYRTDSPLQEPEGWSAFLVSGGRRTWGYSFDNPQKSLEDRIESSEVFKKATHLKGMDRWKYAHLMLQSLDQGTPIDSEYWTILDEDPLTQVNRPDNRLAAAKWDPFERRALFERVCPDYQSNDFRFRYSVGGIVPRT